MAYNNNQYSGYGGNPYGGDNPYGNEGYGSANPYGGQSYNEVG